MHQGGARADHSCFSREQSEGSLVGEQQRRRGEPRQQQAQTCAHLRCSSRKEWGGLIFSLSLGMPCAWQRCAHMRMPHAA